MCVLLAREVVISLPWCVQMEGQLEEAWSVSQTETQRRLELDSEWTRKRLNYQYELSEKSAKLEEAAVKYTRDLQRKEERE